MQKHKIKDEAEVKDKGEWLARINVLYVCNKNKLNRNLFGLNFSLGYK